MVINLQNEYKSGAYVYLILEGRYIFFSLDLSILVTSLVELPSISLLLFLDPPPPPPPNCGNT